MMNKLSLTLTSFHFKYLFTTILLFSTGAASTHIYKSTRSLQSNIPEDDRGSPNGVHNSPLPHQTAVSCSTLGNVLFKPRHFAPLFHEVEWNGSERSKQCCEQHFKETLYCSAPENTYNMETLKWNNFRKNCLRARHHLSYSVSLGDGRKRKSVCLLFGTPAQRRPRFAIRRLAGPEKIPAAGILYFQNGTMNSRKKKTAEFVNNLRSMYGRNFFVSFSNSPRSKGSRKQQISPSGTTTVIVQFNSSFYEEN